MKKLMKFLQTDKGNKVTFPKLDVIMMLLFLVVLFTMLMILIVGLNITQQAHNVLHQINVGMIAPKMIRP